MTPAYEWWCLLASLPTDWIMPRKSVASMSVALAPATIEARIHLIRGLRVMLDSDLAELYGVETGMLNRAVSRNASRFPADFAFVLTPPEAADLRFQIGISKSRGGRRYPPRAFTEQGVAMLSSVLRSTRAIKVNIEIMRAFVRFRAMASSFRGVFPDFLMNW